MNLSLRSSAASFSLLSLCAFSSIAGTPPPDANLFTSYSLSGGYTNVNFLVCGSVPGSGSCYGSGMLGPFGHVGAMLESHGRTVGDAVRHNIFVVDVPGGAGQNDVILYRYELTNTVIAPGDTVTYKLTKQLTKDSFAVTSIGGFSNDPTVSAITTDDRGFVTIAFGTAAGGGNVVIGPDGSLVQGGGGASFLLPSIQGISSKDLSTD